MKWAIGITLAVFFGPMIFLSGLVGLFVQPWSGFWFGEQPVGSIVIGTPSDNSAIVLQPVVSAGHVTDAQRYQLARAAGFVGADAVTATALSIAEDGSGDPAALSAANRDGSRDLGLWQINSGWWPQFGGQQALTDPANNAHAAYVIYGRQGWCAWSTYEASCGPGHNSAYRAFLDRARKAANS